MSDMLLTITATRSPEPVPEPEPEPVLADATDLGHLLHKHPDRAQAFDLSVGRAHVFYPEAGPDRCTAALLLEVDPVGIVRNKRFGGSDAFALAQYVNDRLYAASSMVAVALGQVFRSAMAGRCESRPELAAAAIPLEIHVPALPCRGGAGLARRLFEPLGWTVEATAVPLDPTVPAWGDSRYVDVRLAGTVRLADALNQLYVLLPVLDDAKHYWVSTDEVDKLVRAGGGWLAEHPEREQIARRYLAHQRRYVADATERLAALEDGAVAGVEADGAEEIATVAVAALAPVAPASAASAAEMSATPATAPTAAEVPATADAAVTPTAPTIEPLARLRADAVLAVLSEVGAGSVADLGCGEGALLRRLVADRRFTRILGTDVSARELERAAARLKLHEASDAERERVGLVQSSLTYTDDRIAGFDAAVLMEVVEHLDPSRLDALERTVLGHARPRVVVVTTPNAEFNVHYANLIGGTGEPGSGLRHPDHRFEWTRAEFGAWARSAATRFGYDVAFRDVGRPADGPGPGAPGHGKPGDGKPGDGKPGPDTGTPTQMAVFTRLAEPRSSEPQALSEPQWPLGHHGSDTTEKEAEA